MQNEITNITTTTSKKVDPWAFDFYFLTSKVPFNQARGAEVNKEEDEEANGVSAEKRETEPFMPALRRFTESWFNVFFSGVFHGLPYVSHMCIIDGFVRVFEFW